MADENDPEIQRNGFRVIQETAEIGENNMDDFLENHFDPADTWEENLDRLWDWFEGLKKSLDNPDFDEDAIPEE